MPWLMTLTIYLLGLVYTALWSHAMWNYFVLRKSAYFFGDPNAKSDESPTTTTTTTAATTAATTTVEKKMQ